MDFRSDIVLRGVAWDQTIRSLKDIFNTRTYFSIYLLSMSIGIMYDKRIEKLDEADENGLPGNGIVGNAAFDIEFLDEVGDCLPYFRQAQAFRRRVQHYEARSIAVQDKGVFGGLGKDAH